eukprot:GHVU01192270.1.p1 GENE.GHVU01192270.1~~GHVU01192270.1.p1  ORF type:complete len:121 (-),score=10.30 GHVU01192270.1:704-1066(-)
MENMEKPFLPRLNTKPIQAYREKYQAFRRGFLQGAGSKRRKHDESVVKQNIEQLSSCLIFGGPCPNSALYDELLEWRMEYRRFRVRRVHRRKMPGFQTIATTAGVEAVMGGGANIGHETG